MYFKQILMSQSSEYWCFKLFDGLCLSYWFTNHSLHIHM